MSCPCSPENPESAPIAIDPFGGDLHGEAARLAARGPITRATLPGGVPVWVLTSHEDMLKLMSDPRVSKNWRNWNAFDLGLVPEDWPLLGMVQVTNMFTADGDDHKRLRGPVSRTFTARRVQALAPRVNEIITGLLDALPGLADEDGVVDLRPNYAFQLPMQVICEMFGVPEPWRPKLREVVQTTFDSTITPEVYLRTQEERIELLRKLVEQHRAEPGDDLTSALLSAIEDDPEALSDIELIDTLWLLLVGGHETTLSLITNAVRALLTHPEQLELAVREDRWADVFEETMRWDAPLSNLMARYPLEDIEVGGVRIPKGDAIMASYIGAGRDACHYGEKARDFDIRNATTRHLSFGYGPHVCLGAALARLEGTSALRSLFARFPNLELAVPPEEIPPAPSLFTNTAATLPVRLGTPA